MGKVCYNDIIFQYNIMEVDFSYRKPNSLDKKEYKNKITNI